MRITGYSERVVEIQDELAEAQRMLDAAIAFDGTVNMTTVNDLLVELLMINTTLASEFSRANATFTLVLRDQQSIKNSWNELNMLNESALELAVNLSRGIDITRQAEGLIQDFNETFNSLTSRLTLLAVRFNALHTKFLSINASVANASVSLDDIEADFDSLVTELESRQRDVNETLLLAKQLNTTVISTQSVAQMTLNSVNQLMVS